MGEFLSTPIKEKISHDEENSFLRFGSCCMQGWRKRMEDAHITNLDIGPSNQTQIFGVFDGHGGCEVAKFVSNHFVKEFLNNPNYAKNDIKKALEENYYKMDKLMLEKEGSE
jgi:serine/threonine protein phosphatase PrpC